MYSFYKIIVDFAAKCGKIIYIDLLKRPLGSGSLILSISALEPIYENCNLRR